MPADLKRLIFSLLGISFAVLYFYAFYVVVTHQ